MKPLIDLTSFPFSFLLLKSIPMNERENKTVILKEQLILQPLIMFSESIFEN